MFDMLKPTGIPDSFSEALYKWRGIACWPEAEAVVLECVCTPDAEMPGYCNYQVLSTYPAKDGIQTGRLGINGTAGHRPYITNDTFTLRYNPLRPSVFYYANEMSRLQRIGLVAAFVALGLVGAFLVVGVFPH